MDQIEMLKKQIEIQNTTIENLNKTINEINDISLIKNKKIKKVFNFLKKLFTRSPIENAHSLYYKFLNDEKKKKKLKLLIPYNDNIVFNNLPFDEEALFLNEKIAIQINAKNLDFFDELLENLKYIPVQFDCYITTDTNEKSAIINQKFSSIFPTFKFFINVIEDDNQNSFVAQMSSIYQNYSIICNLQTHQFNFSEPIDNKDLHHYQFKHLLGSKENISYILNKLSSKTNIGIIYPPDYPPLHKNQENKFAADNMFWAKTAAISNNINEYSKIRVFNNTIRKECKRSRIVFFLHFDINNNISETDLDYVKQLSAVSSELVFITNNSLPDSELSKIQKFVTCTIARPNFGYDFKAWSEALNIYGFDNLNKFDDVVFANNSCYAPVFDLETIFYEMNNRNVDFWGITQYHSVPKKYASLKMDVPKHIQSYFLVFTKRVFSSKEFYNFWSSRESYSTIEEVVKNNEIEMTRFFSQFFTHDVFCNSLQNHISTFQDFNYTLTEPQAVLLSGSPLIKKKVFSPDFIDNQKDLISIVLKISDKDYFKQLSKDLWTK